MALWIYFFFFCILALVYGRLLKKITPISLFVILGFLYSALPIVFLSVDAPLFRIIADRYMLFKPADLDVGISFAVISLSIPLAIDWLLIKKITMWGRTRSPQGINKPTSMMFYLKVIILLSSVMYFAGVYMYGVDHYLHGYSDADLGTNYGSRGGALIAFADIMFFVSAGMFLRIKKSSGLILIIAAYALLHFLGGSRLMTVIGLLLIVLVQNKFLISITKKTVWYAIAAFTLIVLVGAFRGSAVDLSAGFMEFAFVGFGYYNLIAIRPAFDLHLYEFIKDIVIYALPAVFDKSEAISKNEIVLSLFSDVRDISPVGGHFFLSDMYLYLGVFAPLAVLILFWIVAKLILLSYRLDDSRFSLIYSFFVALMCSFVLVNLLRNGILSASSAAFKSLVISTFFVLIFKAYKFRIRKFR